MLFLFLLSVNNFLFTTGGGCTTQNDCQITPGQAEACLDNGQCLCNTGWSGPNGVYINSLTILPTGKKWSLIVRIVMSYLNYALKIQYL